MEKSTTILGLLSGAALTVGAAADTTWYVATCGDDAWSGAGQVCEAPDGPKATIQAALELAGHGDMIIVGPGDYDEAIDLLGKAVTLMSADGPDATKIDATGHDASVITCANGEGADTIIRGFTITGGLGTEVGTSLYGGGMYCAASDPTLIDCTFFANDEAYFGGGMAVRLAARPTLIRCRFIDNDAGWGAGIYAGTPGDDPTIVSCTFEGNSAIGGGGLYLCEDSVVTNSVFMHNHASYGGAIRVHDGAKPEVTNCTIIENTATYGGAFFNLLGARPRIRNCVIWANTGGQIDGQLGSLPEVEYCDVMGGFAGTGNIDQDPKCVDPINGDMRLAAGSPCIDAAHNWRVPRDMADLDGDGDTCELIPFDMDGNARFGADEANFDSGCGVPVVVDMGAYEYQFDPVEQIMFGDIDGSGAVDVDDLIQVILDWGACDDPCCMTDLDVDGRVGCLDLIGVMECWN